MAVHFQCNICVQLLATWDLWMEELCSHLFFFFFLSSRIMPTTPASKCSRSNPWPLYKKKKMQSSNFLTRRSVGDIFFLPGGSWPTAHPRHPYLTQVDFQKFFNFFFFDDPLHLFQLFFFFGVPAEKYLCSKKQKKNSFTKLWKIQP